MLQETFVPTETFERVLESVPTLEMLDKLTTQRDQIEGVVLLHKNIEDIRDGVDQAFNNITN